MAAGFKTATVNASDVPATLTDYPAYVDLSRLGITTLAEAQSVRVYADSAKTTEWAREIVSASEMHVKIPSLTSSTVIYVEWDGTSSDYAVTDTYGRNAVWSDYNVVYHFQEASGDVIDSTGGGNDGTVDAGVTRQVTGQIGFAHDYDFSEKTSIAHASDITAASSSFSISMWVNPDTAPSTTSSYPAIKVNNWVINYRTAGWTFGPWGGDVTGGSPSANTWTHLFGYHTNPGTFLYVNGASAASNGSLTNGASGTNLATLAFRTGTSLHWDGQIAEFRFRKTSLTANWGITEYNNQSDEAGFWGTWTDVGGGARRIFNIS